MFKNKRGIEITFEFIFTLLFIIILITIIGLWIHDQGSGSAMKKQILAKEICLLATSAEPGTKIMAEHDKKIEIEKRDYGILIKEGEFDRGYFYNCYLKENVKLSRKDNITIIEIG